MSAEKRKPARRRSRRRSRKLRISFPESLPIAAARRDIAAALAEHSVIVVCGDTGSGKTTQLPKICLEAGRGDDGMIGHTQPRRIAARAVAARLAHELGEKVGGAVGLKVRFNDRTSAETRVKLMTDGILLNEIREDRSLRAYDTLIVDEAHERSLNIDFILGYLKRLVARRRDLKVIVTSATIDPERFAGHFDAAPVLRVEGRSWPVATRYRVREPQAELSDAVVAAANELAAVDLAELGGDGHRDMLVFLPGERWIRDAELALGRNGPEGYEVLPLYARLATKQQHRIFAPNRAPRIVLATNIAETSLTVPRIRFVIDSGLARVSRYATRHRVQRLAVEPIARANAIQRAGRCGRLSPGLCIRLFAEQDFAERPEFMEPEILRTNLAGVMLRLEALGIGHVDDFPFLDAPPTRAVNDAYRLLNVLGATDENRRLTREGRLMGRLPLDPRLARLLLTASRNGTLREALVLAAALSVVDPREHPAAELDTARRQQAVFADSRSDFITMLNLWRAARRARRGGEKAFGAWCARHYLSVARLREWEDVHAQLGEIVAAFGWKPSQRAASYRAIHRAVLSAFVDLVAEQRDGASYRGMHEAKALLFPGTALAKKRPRWIVAAEHIATGRPYLRTVAQINPRWAVEVAPHLVRRSYRDPQWDPQRGKVLAREVVTLFGLTLGDRRRVDYGTIDPPEARRIFIREALARDTLGAEADFVTYNRRLCATLLDWEARLRTRDLFIGERGLANFYDKRLPAQVRDRPSLMQWLRRSPERLEMSLDQLASRDCSTFPEDRYPAFIELAGQRLPLRYRYAPGEADDGITASVPAVLLAAIPVAGIEWLVPGWLETKVLALLRTLPKELRRRFVPLPDTVRTVLPALENRFGRQALGLALREVLAESYGTLLGPDAFDDAALPPYLHMRVGVTDRRGRLVDVSRDFARLREKFASSGDGRTAVSDGSGRWSRRGLTVWDFADLPDSVAVTEFGGTLKLVPALVDMQGRVDLMLLPPGPAVRTRHARGVRRLLIKRLLQQVAMIRKQLLDRRELVLAYHGMGTTAKLVDDIVSAAAKRSFTLEPPVRRQRDFERCLADGRAAFVPSAESLIDELAELLVLLREIRGQLADGGARIPPAAREDIAAQLDELVRPYWLTDTPAEWRPHLKRYLKAVVLRLDKLYRRHPKDAEYMSRIGKAWRRYAEWRTALPPDWPEPAEIVRYRWLVEEFRVSLYAQRLGTVAPVSEKRLEAAWAQASAATVTRK